MSVNNTIYFNAAIAGGSAAILRVPTLSEAALDSVPNVILAFATSVDAAIPNDESSSVAKANLLEAICLSTMLGRSLTSTVSTDYDSVAAGIAQSFSTLSQQLQ